MQAFTVPFIFVTLVFIIIVILYYRQTKKIKSLEFASAQNEKQFLEQEHNTALIIKEMQLKEQHLLEKLQIAQTNNENLHLETIQNLESMKQEYEHKLQAKDLVLQEVHKNHAAKIQEIQDFHKIEIQERLKAALSEQESKLNTQYRIKQEEITQTLTIEREKQEALLTQRFYEISNALLEQKGKQFQEKQELSLKPLTEEILRFKHEIAQNTKENQEKQMSLITEIKLLKDANILISKEANNLASVMKGGAKKQG
ncbi:hypothetical protein CQA44_10895, partial [Helicobacter sp. MIT 14-3879]